MVKLILPLNSDWRCCRTASQQKKRFCSRLLRLKRPQEAINSLIWAKSSQSPNLLFKTASEWRKTKSKDPFLFKSFFNASERDTHLSKLVELYEAREDYRLNKLDDNSRRKHLNPRRLAIKTLIDHIGTDKLVSELTRDDAKSFHAFLKKKISDGKIVENTANKYLMHIRTLLSGFNKEHDTSMMGQSSTNWTLTRTMMNRIRASIQQNSSKGAGSLAIPLKAWMTAHALCSSRWSIQDVDTKSYAGLIQIPTSSSIMQSRT